MKLIPVPADVFSSLLSQLRSVLDADTLEDLAGRKGPAATAWRAGRSIELQHRDASTGMTDIPVTRASHR